MIGMLRLISCSLFFAVFLHASDRVPVLIELFTSEGCSSCPPADALLAELEKSQPVSNADVIVLSEHVDYWNRLGWTDPFSAPIFSQRQQSYADMLHADDVYTPQAIIDGRYSTVGSNRQNVFKAIESSSQTPKPALQITEMRQGNILVVSVPRPPTGDVWIALTQMHAVSHVANGENGGRTLQHAGVVRSLTKVKGTEARIALDKQWGSDLRVVAFVQDPRSGRVLQATAVPAGS